MYAKTTVSCGRSAGSRLTCMECLGGTRGPGPRASAAREAPGGPGASSLLWLRIHHSPQMQRDVPKQGQPRVMRPPASPARGPRHPRHSAAFRSRIEPGSHAHRARSRLAPNTDTRPAPHYPQRTSGRPRRSLLSFRYTLNEIPVRQPCCCGCGPSRRRGSGSQPDLVAGHTAAPRTTWQPPGGSGLWMLTKLTLTSSGFRYTPAGTGARTYDRCCAGSPSARSWAGGLQSAPLIPNGQRHAPGPLRLTKPRDDGNPESRV